MKKFSLFLLLALAFVLNGAEPKYVFLFIGDGMSFPQVMMTQEFLIKTENRKLVIKDLPFQAVTTTSSANSFITDSAAAATAIACGTKTNNGSVGVDPEGNPLQSSAAVAKESGRKVGIITTVTINHATPAGFYAHNISRSNYYQIALDMLDSGFDFFCGGVAQNDLKSDPKYRGDIYTLASEKGFKVVRDAADFAKLSPADGKALVAVTKAETPYTIDSPDDQIRLSDFVAKAIEMLDNDNGFFIMAEGGKIDWACHSNDAATVLRDLVELDKAVKVALDFAERHPDETLIVVTGDHETGGLTLGFGGTGYRSFIENLDNQKVSIGTFSQKLKELGKNGKPDFEQVKKLITSDFGLIFADDPPAKTIGTMVLSKAETAEIKAAYERQYDTKKPDNKNALAIAVIKCLDNKASLGWTSGAHTALPVLTMAKGVGGENFSSQLDNTDISKRLKKILQAK